MPVSGLSTDQQEYGTSWSALGVVATISAAWKWKKRKTQGDTKKDNLDGDTTDPRRKNRLHCVLEAVITSSVPFETTSSGSFTGDRAKAEDNLAGDKTDLKQQQAFLCPQNFFEAELLLELQCPPSYLDQCAGCAASEEERAR